MGTVEVGDRFASYSVENFFIESVFSFQSFSNKTVLEYRLSVFNQHEIGNDECETCVRFRGPTINHISSYYLQTIIARFDNSSSRIRQ